MALIPQISTCVVNGCSQIKITETTGIYTASNLTGYESPNNSLTSITSAVLNITSPSNVVYTIDLFTQGFPSGNLGFSYIIPTATLRLTVIEDGLWTFVYTVSDGTNSFSSTKYSLFYCNSECCVTKKLVSLQLENCDCCKNDNKFNDYVLTQTMLESLKNAAKCGDSTKFTKLKKIINKLCLNSGCKTCK